MILNKNQAGSFISPYRYAMIGVVSPMEQHPNYQDGYVDLLKLNFAEIDFNCDTFRAITENDVENILQFVEKNKELVDLFVIHCGAGISRSSGIAAALSKIYNDDDSWVFKNPKYMPNMRVYKKILDAAVKNGLLKDDGVLY